jgi:hypothetical protein
VIPVELARLVVCRIFEARLLRELLRVVLPPSPDSFLTFRAIEALAWIVVESIPMALPQSSPLWAATERMKRKPSLKTSSGSGLCVLLT